MSTIRKCCHAAGGTALNRTMRLHRGCLQLADCHVMQALGCVSGLRLSITWEPSHALKMLIVLALQGNEAISKSASTLRHGIGQRTRVSPTKLSKSAEGRH